MNMERKSGLSRDGYNLLITLDCGCFVWVDVNDAYDVIRGKQADEMAEYGIDPCPRHT